MSESNQQDLFGDVADLQEPTADYMIAIDRLQGVARIIIESDYKLDVGALAAKYSSHLDDPDEGEGEHPLFDRDAWIEAVQEGETQLGYWELVKQQVGAAWMFVRLAQAAQGNCCGAREG